MYFEWLFVFPDAFIRKAFNTYYYFYCTSSPVSLKLERIYVSEELSTQFLKLPKASDVRLSASLLKEINNQQVKG